MISVLFHFSEGGVVPVPVFNIEGCVAFVKVLCVLFHFSEVGVASVIVS